MPREIAGTSISTGEFYPLVSIRNAGNYVKGKVLAKGETINKNPTVTLALIDLDGSTQTQVSKGRYQEIEVSVGDKVQVVGSVKDLREKLPQLEIGDIVTVAFVEKVKTSRGGSKNIFKVTVD